MGQKPSAPQPGVKLKVIGAGLPRTGTASFARALELLYGEPTYHGGTQVSQGPVRNVKAWTRVHSLCPFKSERDRAEALGLMKDALDGFAATADSSPAQFVPELLELYPDALVVCTVREKEKWAASLDAVHQTTSLWYLEVLLLPLPVMRHMVRYMMAMVAGRWGELYVRPGDPNMHGVQIWDRHIAWLQEVVPKEKLLFFDVRDGWEPLCRALEMPVPEGVEFPRINDGEAIQRFAKRQIAKAAASWTGIFAVLGVAIAVGWRAWSA